MRSNYNAAKETGNRLHRRDGRVMVYGMVCYNIALDVGGMQNFIFAAALSELPIMGVIGYMDTFLVGPAWPCASPWVGSPPARDKQVLLVAAISLPVGLDDVPVDELFATLFFKRQPQRKLFAMWVQTTAMNYPTAFLWQLVGAGRWCGLCSAKGWPP